MIAGFEFHVTRLLRHIVSATIVHDLLAIHEQPRSVVGIQVKCITPILGNFENASPAHVKVVYELGARKRLERAGEIDILVHSLKRGFAVAADGGKVLEPSFHLKVFSRQPRFQLVRGEYWTGDKQDEGERQGSFFYIGGGHRPKARTKGPFVNRAIRILFSFLACESNVLVEWS